MSLLDDLRVNIADDAAAPSGSVLVSAASTTLLGNLRIDIADEAVSSSGTIPYVPLAKTIVDDLLVQGNLEVCGAQYWGMRIITTSGNVTVTDSDMILLINKTVGESTTVTVPAPSATDKSRILIIKDMKGDAATNNITIVAGAGTIDGQNSWVMNQNNQSFTLIDNGTEWNIV